MIKQLTILFVIAGLLQSCSKETSNDCNCKDVNGRYYHNVQKDFLTDGYSAIEDFDFNKGNLTIHRETVKGTEVFKNVAKYEVLDNCVMRFHSFNKNVYKPLPISYRFVLGVGAQLNEGVKEISEPMVNYDCDGFNFRSIKMLTFNPRK
jgi:hypothetical protein